MRSITTLRAAWAIVLLCFSAACASAPPPSVGAVRGFAVDQDGDALPGITVTLQSLEGKAVDTVTTGPDGAYEFPAVPVGQYRVVSLFAGYSTPTPLEVKVTPAGLAVLPRLVLASPD
jgi:hypothetical protein